MNVSVLVKANVDCWVDKSATDNDSVTDPVKATPRLAKGAFAIEKKPNIY